MERRRAAGMYLKPIMGNMQLDPQKVLRQLKYELNKRLRRTLIDSTAFSLRAKRALAKSMQIKIGKNSVIVTTNHPGFFPMIKGQRSGQMTWLVKAKAPIPIMTDEGKLIFRSATPKSMENGKWVHPGRQPSDFIERAKKEARGFVKERLAKEVMRTIQSAIGGG